MKVTEEISNLQSIREAIKKPHIKVVSFDVFDTLLVRPVQTPTDLFYIMEMRIHDEDRLPELPFLDLRRWAEKQARDRMRQIKPFYEDINLDEIYDEMALHTDLSPEICNRLKQIELDVELKYLSPRKTLQQIYKYAVSLGKRIIIASDVYLPESTVFEALQRNGYDRIERYFVSSQLRLSKGRGGLYSRILRDMDINASEIVHIGDNLKADVINARKVGFTAFHVPKTSALMDTARMDNSLWRERLTIAQPGLRILHGMIQNELFDTISRESYDQNSHVNGNPYFLGYYALGPFVLSLVQWLIHEAAARQDEVVAFVARDGYIPKIAYDLIAPLYSEAPPSLYFRASRSVCYPFDVDNICDLMFSSKNLHFERSQPIRNLIETRLFLEIDKEFETWLIAQGIDLDATCKDLPMLIATLARYPWGIMHGLEKHRDLARRFYADLFDKYDRISVFDCGYTARTQRVLSKILPHKKFFGYYVASFEGINRAEQENLRYDNFIAPTFDRAVVDEPFVTALLELFLCEFEIGSIVGFDKTETGVSPVIEDNPVDVLGKRTVTAIHTGCIDFVRKAVTHFGIDLKYLNVTPSSSFFTLKEIMLNPHAKDAKIFSKISFSNGITGEVRQMIAQDETRSKWKQGWHAIHKRRDARPSIPSQGHPRRIQLQGRNIIHQGQTIPAQIDQMRVLPAFDFLNGIALLSKTPPSPDLHHECRDIVRQKSKWLAAAVMLRDSGGLWRSNLTWRDKLRAQGYLTLGRFIYR